MDWSKFKPEPNQERDWSTFNDWSKFEAEKPPGPPGIIGRAKDLGISALKGIIGVPEAAVGLADIVTGGYAGKAAEAVGFRPKEAKEFLSEGYSDAQKKAFQEVQQAEGLWDTFKAAVSNPSVLAQSVTESVPLMLGGGVVAHGARGLMGARLGAIGAGAIGEGAVSAGSFAEQVRQQNDDGLLSAGQSALAATSGALTGGLGMFGAKVAKSMGITDIDTLLAGAARDAAMSKSLTRRVLEGALSEGVLEELPQSVQEQVLQNQATGRPLDEGVSQAAVLGTLSGAVMGGGINVLQGKPKDIPGAAKPEAPPAPLLLGDTPDPIVVFPDGTAGRRSDIDAYINGLPEDQRVAARAKLMGMGARDATPEDILKAPDADSAIAAFAASLTGTDMGSMLGQDNPLVTASRDMQERAAADEADLADLAQSEARDLNTLRALAAEDARKQQELDALQATGTGQYGVPIEARPAVEAAATVEAPTAMQLALQRAQERATPQPTATTAPVVEQSLAAAKQELAAAAPAPIQRQPDILPGDISRNDGKPFQTESGARLKQRYSGGIDGSDIVQVVGGYVVRPKAAPADTAAATTIQTPGVQSATGGVPAAVVPSKPIDQPLTQEIASAQTAKAQQDQAPRQEPAAAGAASIDARSLDPAVPAEGGAVPTKAQDQRLIPVSKREKTGAALTAPRGLRVTFGGKSYPVDSIEDAQRKWIKFQESADGGAPVGVSQVGNGVRITDQDGNFVARISFNGRAWDSEDDGANLIAEAPSIGAPDQRLVPVSKRAPPEQTDLTDDETAAEFERLYQEDIKADIRRRLGLESPEKAEKQAPSRFRTFLRKHGIKPQYASDITGDRGFRANNMLPATFRRNGLGIDELAIRALEEGYLTQAEFDSDGDVGGTNRLMEMIQAELRGQRQESNADADESAEAELDRVRRMELEDMAQSLGLPFDADMDAAALAGMVARVQRALDKSREPKGSTKAERVRQNAIAAAKRIEAKRQKYERELEEFAKADAVEQNAFLEVLMDDDGTPVVSRLADLEAEEAWNATLGTWSDQNGQSTRAEIAPARQAEAPDAQAAGQRPGDAQEGDPGQQRRSDQGQEEGLTAPTRADVLRQQDQAEAEAARKEQGGDKPLPAKKVTGDTPDLFNTQGSVFDQPAEPEPASSVAQASTILDEANVTGKDRLDILKDVKSGALTPDEVQAAYPGAKPKERLTDAGEELIRNRRGKLKGLAWDDVSAMNDTLKVAQVIKSNVWPRPDYAKMVEDGAPAWKAAALKAIYDKLAAAPVTRTAPTDADLRAYIETMNQAREALMAELDRVEREGGGDRLWDSLRAGNVFGKVFPIPDDAKPMFGKPSPFDRKSEQGKENNRRALLIGGNAAVQALQFNYKVTSKVKDLLAEGFPAKREAWEKSYEVRQTETRDSDVPESERTGEPQRRFYVYEKGSRWRLAKGGQDGGYATQEQAEAFARTLTAKKREALPPSRGLDLADVRRTGPDWRKGQNVTSDQLMEHFGFRGVNLGEYVKAKQDVAQLHLNHAFDAFNDLADLLGVPPKAMSLNGTLGLAIGAQGSGKALAHFVPGVNEINITRDSGAGALAHEFGHAVDHYFATQHGRAASMAKRPYLSAVVENVNDVGGVRPEVMDAMRTVMKAINSRPMTEAEAKKYMADQRALNERRMDRWVVEFRGNRGADPEALAAVAEKLKRGDVGEVRDDDVESNLAEFMRAAGFKPGNMLAANAFTTAYRLRDLADEARFMASHIPQMETNYSKVSAAMDAKKTGDGYWGTPWEKFARAFETFVMDALADRQRESLYLSGLVDSKGWQSWSGATGKSIPYPAGDERLVMQQAFQKLFDTLETTEDDAGNVSIREPDAPYETDLFGNPVPAPAGTPGRTGPDQAGLRGNVQRTAGVRDTPAPAGEYFVNTLVSTETQRELGTAKVLTPEHAAQATAYLYKSAVERLDGIVTDKNGNVLAVVGGFKGALAQASVYPATIVAEAVRVPGAAKIWFSHNHPSGSAVLSRADENLEGTLSRVFQGSGIEPMGLLAVAGERFAYIRSGGGTPDGYTGDIPATVTRKKVPVYERELAAKNVKGLWLTSPTEAKATAQLFYAKAKAPGMMLLDSQHALTAWVPITPEMMQPLKGGALNAIYRAISQSNAGAVVFVHGGELDASPQSLYGQSIGKNIGAAMAQIDVRVLDSVNAVTGKSAAERGESLVGAALFARSKPGRGVHIDDANAVVAAVREALPTAPPIHIMESVAQAPEKLRDEIKAQGAENDVDAAYHDGEIYVFPANIPNIERMQFVLAHHEIRHHGLRTMLGSRMNATMLKIHESNPTIRALAAEQVRKGFAKSRILATEEALADMPVEDLVKLNGWDRIVAAVREWLRGAAARLRRVGLAGVADAIDAKEWTDKDVAALIARAEGVSRGGSARYATEGTVFDRQEGDQTSTPAFLKWFGKSKAVDKDGRPLRVFHGTHRDFSAFDAKAPSSHIPLPGFYFTPDPDIASTFAENGAKMAENKAGRPFAPIGSNVMPAYLSIQNPLDVDVAAGGMKGFVSEKVIKDVILEAKRLGHDGVILRGWADGSGPVQYIAFDPAQVKSAIGNNGSFDPTNPDIRFARSAVTGRPLPQTWQAPDPTRMDDLLYSMQDKHIDTKRVVTAVRDAIGGIADNLDPYLQEELYHGRAAMATKEFLEKSIRPLLTDMQARGIEMSDFEEYLHNRHAERRNIQVAKVNPNMPDGGSGIKTADARAYLAGLPAAKRTAYQALAKRVDQINRDTRTLLVSSGLEKQSTINAWQAAYGDEYVPLMREEMDDGTIGIGQGFSVRGSSSKRAMGSNKPVANILANIALQREKAITRAEKRRIGEALYGMVLTAPNPDFWFAVDPALEQSPAQITATAMQLISMGMNPVDAQSIAAEPRQRYIDPRTNQVAERINPALRSADNVLAVRIDGEDKYVFFNAKDPRAMRMAQALKNLDSDQLGVVMGNAAKMTRYFASINTQYNPIFGVVNLTRDIQTALLNLQSTRLAGQQAEVMRHVGSALRGIYIDLRDHRAGKQPTSSWANLFEEFQREGGATGYRDMYANAQERADAITDELKRIKQGRAMEVGRGIFGWLSDYNESMENAVRLATYKVAKEQGMSNQQAASLAKNLTVNFNRKGQVALQAGALYAFFNASVQGTARMAETMFAGKKLSGIGKKIITGGLLLGSMQALLLAAAGYDDEEPPDFVRERALVFPIGGDKYVSIPMPLGFHVIPNLARIPTEWALGGFRDTPKRLGQLVGLFFDAFNPIGSAGVSLQTITPTIIDPLAALAENRDWTGKPIAKKDFNSMQPTAGHTRAKDTATPWARMISYGINIATGGTDYKPGLASPTPDQIDYLIGQATGGVGREVSKLSQVGSSAVSGEELPLYKIPLLGRFVGTTAGQAAESGRFYENLKEIGEHDAELTGLKKDRRMAEYREYLRDNPDARMVPAAERAHREVSKLMRMKRDAIRDGASQERVRMLDQQITARMRAFNARVREMEPAT